LGAYRGEDPLSATGLLIRRLGNLVWEVCSSRSAL